jgi:hypothetical protein
VCVCFGIVSITQQKGSAFPGIPPFHYLSVMLASPLSLLPRCVPIMLRSLVRAALRPHGAVSPAGSLLARQVCSQPLRAASVVASRASTALRFCSSLQQHALLTSASHTRSCLPLALTRSYSFTRNGDSWADLESHVEAIGDAESLDTSQTFEQMGLSPQRTATLSAKGLTYPFPIQSRTFADIKSGRDVVGRARTGTGKTLAFALPIVENIDPKAAVGPSPCCVVLGMLQPTSLSPSACTQTEL